MKFWKVSLSALLACALSATMLLGCQQQQAAWDENEEFTYSKGIDENGYWANVKALDYVTLSDNYLETKIPSDVATVSDEEVQSQIDSLVSSYSTTEEITDRAVEDGDTVNIDYVGSIDGVEFSGGSTGGNGTEVIIGTSNFIDDFLTQLIGHMPGETFNVEVTFPEDYGNEELNGKDAVFVTTVNHIVKTNEPELTDDFVKENLEATYGWATVAEMEEGITSDLQQNAIDTYISESILEKGEVSSIPEVLTMYNKEALTFSYENAASEAGMELSEYLSSSVGVESMEELMENYAETMEENSKYALIVQAIAEDQSIEVSDEDITEYFKKLGTDDYSEYETNYGKPYLKQVVISQKVYDLLIDNVVLP